MVNKIKLICDAQNSRLSNVLNRLREDLGLGCLSLLVSLMWVPHLIINCFLIVKGPEYLSFYSCKIA